MKKDEEESREKIRLIEERLKLQEEKNAIHLKYLEKENEIRERLHTDELKFTALESKYSQLQQYIIFYGIIVTVVLTAVTFFGRVFINDRISAEIDTYAKPRVDTAIQLQITQENIDSIINVKSEIAVNLLVDKYKQKEDTAIGRTVNEVNKELKLKYESNLTFFKSTSITPNLELPDSTKRKLSDFEKSIKQLKTEANYSFDDWYYKGIDEAQKNRFPEAIESFTRALKMIPLPSPELVNALNSRAYSYMRNSEYQKAINDYDQLLKIYPNANVFVNRGICYVGLDKAANAIADYTKAIELNSNDSLAYINRADVYFGQKQYAKAISDYSKHIELNPMDANAYIMRGQAYNGQNQITKALVDINKAAELRPQDKAVYIVRAAIYLKQGSAYDKVLRDAKRAHELDGTDVDAYNLLGYAYTGLRQYDNAINAYNKYILLNPKESLGYICLAGVLIMTNNFQDALLNCQKSLVLIKDSEQNVIAKWEECILFKILGQDTKK